MHWLQLRDHYPSPLLHMAASMVLLMVPYVSIVPAFMRSMLGRETHWMDVSFGRKYLHIICSTCYKGSMGDNMATTATNVSIYEGGHRIEWTPYDGDFQLIIYGMVWASLICSVGGGIFGDLALILPGEGNIIAA